MRYKTVKINLYIILILILGLLTACQSKNSYSPPPPPMVTIDTPIVEDITNYLEFTGLTKPIEQVEITPRVDGYLEKIMFTPGSFVKKGDLLFIIDQKPYKAKLRETKAKLTIEEAKLNVVKTKLEKSRMAFKRKAVSEINLVQAEADVETAKASIEAAKANIKTAELELSYTTIYSPIDGQIDRSSVDEGNFLSISKAPILATIIKDDSIYVYFNLNERDLLEYKLLKEDLLSRKLTLDLIGNEKSYHGKVDYISNRINSETGNLQLRAIFKNNKHEILSGMFSTIKMPVSTLKKSILVPNEAIGRDQRGFYVLSVNSSNIVEYHSVDVGPVVGKKRVIKSGILQDAEIIVNGYKTAYPGTEVSPTKKSQNNTNNYSESY